MEGCFETMSQPPIIPLKPIPIRYRISMIFVYYGRIDVKDGAFVVINEVDGEDLERKHIPVGSVACIMLEPGRVHLPRSGGECSPQALG
jgi:CRISPR-associated protein Cas1